MIRRLFAVGFLIAVVLAGWVMAPAQTSDARAPFAANEAKSRAILAERSIRFELPFNRPAGPGVRIIAWLLSPVGMPPRRQPLICQGAHD
jgi:hypothetical protein